MEAVKLRVKDFCFAPSLKDAGIAMSFGKTEISKRLAKGMPRAITTSVSLSQKKLLKPMVLADINLLAGQAQAANSYKGLQYALDI